MELSFAKMHGLGNDFVFIDDRNRALKLTDAQVSYLCDRHFGIGADGVILVRPATSEEGDGYMHYINADGTLAQMCGNGVRCFAKYLVDRELADVASGHLLADTLAGFAPHRLFRGCGGKDDRGDREHGRAHLGSRARARRRRAGLPHGRRYALCGASAVSIRRGEPSNSPASPWETPTPSASWTIGRPCPTSCSPQVWRNPSRPCASIFPAPSSRRIPHFPRKPTSSSPPSPMRASPCACGRGAAGETFGLRHRRLRHQHGCLPHWPGRQGERSYVERRPTAHLLERG